MKEEAENDEDNERETKSSSSNPTVPRFSPAYWKSPATKSFVIRNDWVLKKYNGDFKVIWIETSPKPIKWKCMKLRSAFSHSFGATELICLLVLLDETEWETYMKNGKDKIEKRIYRF